VENTPSFIENSLREFENSMAVSWALTALISRFYYNHLVVIHSRYGDGAGNTIEENSSVFSLILMR